MCTYRATLKGRDKDKSKKRSTPATSGPGAGASGVWNAAELRAAEREAKAEIDELRQGQIDARMLMAAQMQRERDGNNAGLDEDEAVQLAMLLSMEGGSDVASTSMSGGPWGRAQAAHAVSEYEDGYEDDYSYAYEDSMDSIGTPTGLSRSSRAGSARPTGNTQADEDDEFAGMSDGEIEAIRAVRDFEQSQR